MFRLHDKDPILVATVLGPPMQRVQSKIPHLKGRDALPLRVVTARKIL